MTSSLSNIHDEAGSKGEPLVVGDWFMVSVSHLNHFLFSFEVFLNIFDLVKLQNHGPTFSCFIGYRKGDEDIEGEGDEDGGDKAEEEEEDEEVLDEMLLHKTLLLQTFTGCEYELKKVPASKLITVGLRSSCWLTHSYNNSIKTSTSWDLCTPCHMIVSCCICVLCCVSCFLLH